MSIRKLQKGDEILLEKFLSNYAETSMFLRSNLRRSGLEYKDESFHGEYFGSFTKTGEINGVIAHYWNGNIMTQAIDENVLKQLIATFQKNVSRPIAGIVGSCSNSDIVISNLGLSDANFILNRNEGLYALDLNDLKLPSKLESSRYHMVEVKEVERSIIFEWIKNYEIESFGSEDNDALTTHVNERVDNMNSGYDCWVLMVDNQPVSLSGFNARLPDIVQIGPVWTPPEFRSKGYARTLVASTLQQAKEEDVQKSILFTDNPAAIKSYESIGFKEIGLYKLAILKKSIDLNNKT